MTTKGMPKYHKLYSQRGNKASYKGDPQVGNAVYMSHTSN